MVSFAVASSASLWMWPSRRLVAAPGLFVDEVTVRLGEYDAQAELVNASETTAALVRSASRMTLFMRVLSSEFVS
jgi:hypothetical protein